MIESMIKEIYLQQAIGAFTKCTPPLHLIVRYFNVDGDDTELQDWVGNNTKPEFFWSTCIGIIEAAEHIVKDAYSNGNIK